MNRADLKTRLDEIVYELGGIQAKLQAMPETTRVVRTATWIEAAIDDLRSARAVVTVTRELDQED